MLIAFGNEHLKNRASQIGWFVLHSFLFSLQKWKKKTMENKLDALKKQGDSQSLLVSSTLNNPAVHIVYTTTGTGNSLRVTSFHLSLFWSSTFAVCVAYSKSHHATYFKNTKHYLCLGYLSCIAFIYGKLAMKVGFIEILSLCSTSNCHWCCQLLQSSQSKQLLAEIWKHQRSKIMNWPD